MRPQLDTINLCNSMEFQALSADRRSDPRFLIVCRLVKVEHAGVEGLGRCRNISDGGARLELHMELHLGEHVSIAFSPVDIVSGSIVWVAGNDYGVAFDAPIDCLEVLADASRDPVPPRAPRLTTNLPAKIAYPSRARPTVVSDLSVRGTKIASTQEFHPGLHVRVILSGGREIKGVVRWTRDNIAGVMLIEPSSIEELGSVKRLS